MKDIASIIDSYDPNAPLADAFTIPGSWYTDERLFELEKQTVFSDSWHVAARTDQLRIPGDYVTCEIAGEPIVIVHGADNLIRGFFNVCRHHAAAVMTEEQGRESQLRCPYHGWTYALSGELKGTPDFSEVCNFDRAANGLVPIETDVWESWVFVRLNARQDPPLANSIPSLSEFFGLSLIEQIRNLGLVNLHWLERRRYTLECNWKVFVDNYLDGGYHVPHLHKGLDSILEYKNYTIENGERFCLQSSPIDSSGAEPETGDARQGSRALYYWLYPNFMINRYDRVMDTNLVLPLGVDRTEVIFDFYSQDNSTAAADRNSRSIEVAERIQMEDEAICESVQRGLKSRAYQAGRLSVRREAGEHLFHRLLYKDLVGKRGKGKGGN
jgi:choline monooxygenase